MLVVFGVQLGVVLGVAAHAVGRLACIVVQPGDPLPLAEGQLADIVAGPQGVEQAPVAVGLVGVVGILGVQRRAVGPAVAAGGVAHRLGHEVEELPLQQRPGRRRLQVSRRYCRFHSGSLVVSCPALQNP